MATLNGALLGFLVQELPDDVSSHDLLHQRRIVYPTWDAAIRAASELANSIGEKYESKITCILRSASYTLCLENGYVISHRIHDWRCDVIIFPVFSSP
jgi:arabinogalactan endo-1,4-beta-galactosidase